MAAPSPTHPGFAKTRGHHAPYTGTEESRYRTKCRDLKRKITDVENENDNLTIKIDRAKRSITRLRLERALLLEKLEEKTPAHVDDSEGSESELSSVEPGKAIRAQPSGSRRRSSTAGTSYTTLSEQSPPPAPYHPPARAPPTNPRLHVVMQNPATGKGRRGTPKGGARPSPAPKPPRDPNAPKRPTNPFLRFCEHERDNVRAQHGGDENFDLTKAMGQAWHELDDEQKQPYKDAFNEDQKKYKEDMALYEAMKRRAETARTSGAAAHHHHHHHHHHHAHQPSSRTEEYGSFYEDDGETDDGRDAANITGRESPDPMDRGETASNADVGTPGGGSTPGPTGASGFTAVNRRSGALDSNMFKQED